MGEDVWWAHWDSNPEPRHYECLAPTNCAMGPSVTSCVLVDTPIRSIHRRMSASVSGIDVYNPGSEPVWRFSASPPGGYQPICTIDVCPRQEPHDCLYEGRILHMVQKPMPLVFRLLASNGHRLDDHLSGGDLREY